MISKSPRNFYSFPIQDISLVKLQVLNWANQFNTCSFFDNHQYVSAHHSFECLLGAGVKRSIRIPARRVSALQPGIADAQQEPTRPHEELTGSQQKLINSFDRLKAFYDEEPDWMFGHFAYDLKNETEWLSSNNPDGVHFPDLYFFVPEYIIQLSATEIAINSATDIPEEAIWKAICETAPSRTPSQTPADSSGSIQIQSRFSPEEYVSTVEKLQQHIQQGDCYEINFCQEFFAEGVQVDPLAIYSRLSRVSPNPFSAYYRLNDRYLLCASPERYLKKVNERVISQPIKGTQKRETENGEMDTINKERLFISEKDRAENVMVVDLVRNDLSRICEEGSVKVEELFSIYTFPQVYQMISTISGRVNPSVHWTDIVRATFPMGSMTGAPKKKVMELIEKYEKTRRGIYSGALGYVTPSGDFDFNVVIRSLALNMADRYLSYQVGSAITFKSDPREEYQECLVKAAAIEKVLQYI